MITIPPYLERGDTIGIVATARKVSPEEMEPAVKLLTDAGFRVALGRNLFADDNQFAGTDQQRAADVMQMVNDSAVKAILCARGGYGSARILEYLDYDAIAAHPKWLCGYSDVTIMHALYGHLGLASLHSTMPINFPKDGAVNNPSTQSLIDSLCGRHTTLAAEANPLNVQGEAEGILVGGNLSLIYSLMATDLQLDTEKRILFIEDLDEYLYHMDRTMLSLRQSGVLSQLAGIAVGYLNDMNDNTIPFGKTAEEIVYEHTHRLGIPVAFGIPAGHLEPNYTMIFGERYHLSVGEGGSQLMVE
jgi:muramoyltetrapeptide carboxypeptidase